MTSPADDSRRDSGADTTVDLLVVGSGTGMAAALTAHELGLSVLIVEKSSYVGGSTARSGGALWFPASPVLAEGGANDTAERAATYLDSVVAGSAPRARSTAFVNHVSGDGRDAAPNDSAALLLGPRLLRLPPRGAGRQRCGSHLRMPSVRHLDARRVPQ